MNTTSNRPPDPLDLKKLLFKIPANWHWFVLSVALAVFAAWMINRYTLPVYSVSTTLMIQPTTPTNASIDNLMDDLNGVRRLRRQDDLYTNIEYLQSNDLVSKTLRSIPNFEVSYLVVGNIKKTKIYTSCPFIVDYDTTQTMQFNYPVLVTILDPDRYLLEIDDRYEIKQEMRFGEPFSHPDFHFKVRWRSEEMRNQYMQNEASNRTFLFKVMDWYDLTNRYIAKMSVRLLDERARTVKITLTGENIQREVDFLSQLTQTYMNDEVENKNQVAENTSRFVEKQIKNLEDSLRRDQSRLMDFRLRNGLFQLDNHGENLYSQVLKLQDDKASLVIRKYYLDYLNGWLDELNQKPDAVLPVLPEIGSGTLTSQVSSYNDLLLKRARSITTSKSQSPDMQEIDREISESRRIAKETLHNEMRWNETMMKNLDERMQTFNEQLREIPMEEQQLLAVQRKYDLTNTLYTFFLQKRAEMGIARASNIPTTRVFEKADSRRATIISPDLYGNFTKALLIGLLVPVLLLVLLEFLNTRITSKSDVEAYTQLPILGVIAHNRKHTDIPVVLNPRSVLAESFRSLRTNLQYILREPGCKSVLVTSTVPGEGKSFTSANLAAALAATGKKTLLISLDLRKPRLHSYFNLSNEGGISGFLIGQKAFGEVVRPLDVPGLFLATAGPIPPNPAELLETPALAEFFGEAMKNFDYLVIDTPPLSVVSDALHISHFAQASLFVLRQDYSHKNALPLINEIHQQDRMKNISLLVNDVRQGRSYGPDFGYGYGYGKGYYDESNGNGNGIFTRVKRLFTRR